MERAVKLAQQGGTTATLKIIPQAGHLLPLEQPDQANTTLKQFLDATAIE
jgi:pimeloyl-ACP methyl ester carboxylesterase